MSAKTRSTLAFDPATVDLDGLLKRLSLANARRNWKSLLERAEAEHWSCREFLGVLATEEVAQRQQTRVQRAVREAHFPFLKTVDDFDFSLQSSLRLQLLGNYLCPEMVGEGRNVILLAMRWAMTRLSFGHVSSSPGNIRRQRSSPARRGAGQG